MNEIEITEADLQAYVDRRLEGPRLAQVEAYLAANPGEQTRIGAYRDQSERLRELYAPVLDEVVPERFARVRATPRWRLAALAAGIAGIALGGIGGWHLHGFYQGPGPAAAVQPALARHAAIAHATYSPEVRHPVEVGADQEAHLVAWLSKRLGAKVRAPNLESAGFALVGGRLLPGEPNPVAQFMYQSKPGARVTLYVRTGVQDQEETAFRYSDEGKVRVFYWIDRSFGYAVSSGDIGKEALLQIANAAYSQLNP